MISYDSAAAEMMSAFGTLKGTWRSYHNARAAGSS